jgi:mannose/cellobiose epimerase-like protein (N-acyl-D-glucosamine 2-epimerase family)
VAALRDALRRPARRGAHRRSGLPRDARQVHDYTFATFPNPDRNVGEWIQIRDRQGRPLDKVVGLPVKDPYHLTRNLLLLVELLGEGTEARTTGA